MLKILFHLLKEERQKELTKRREKIQSEYSAIQKRNKEIDDYLEDRSWKLKRALDNPVMTSDPELMEMYREKAERLRTFQNNEANFRYEMKKEWKRLNEKMSQEEEDISISLKELEEESEEQLRFKTYDEAKSFIDAELTAWNEDMDE